MNYVTCKIQKCNNATLNLRKTLPRTAHKGNAAYFDYYQCPICKANYANIKRTM